MHGCEENPGLGMDEKPRDVQTMRSLAPDPEIQGSGNVTVPVMTSTLPGPP